MTFDALSFIFGLLIGAAICYFARPKQSAPTSTKQDTTGGGGGPQEPQ